ncbi:hypothetical protein U1Q18_032328, partial [Sarracenia purpurea var. burkii]
SRSTKSQNPSSTSNHQAEPPVAEHRKQDLSQGHKHVETPKSEDKAHEDELKNLDVEFVTAN